MNIRRILLSLFMVVSLLAAAMTDDQVIAYIKRASAAGKADQQIGRELMAKGVTPEQAERIKARLEQQSTSERDVTDQKVGASKAERRHNAANDVSDQTVDEIEREVDKGSDNTVSARQIYGHEVFNARALTFDQARISPPRRIIVSARVMKS